MVAVKNEKKGEKFSSRNTFGTIEKCPVVACYCWCYFPFSFSPKAMYLVVVGMQSHVKFHLSLYANIHAKQYFSLFFCFCHKNGKYIKDSKWIWFLYFTFFDAHIVLSYLIMFLFMNLF